MKVKEGNGYVTLTRTEDNFFVSSGDLTFPLSDPINIRVVSTEGESLDDQVLFFFILFLFVKLIFFLCIFIYLFIISIFDFLLFNYFFYFLFFINYLIY